MQTKPTAILLPCIHSVRGKKAAMCNTNMKELLGLHTADRVTESKEGKTNITFSTFVRSFVHPSVRHHKCGVIPRSHSDEKLNIARDKNLKILPFPLSRLKKVEAQLLSEEDSHHLRKSNRCSKLQRRGSNRC